MLDENDKKIIEILTENSRLSYRQIVKKLENEKIIKKYSALLDYEKLGFDIDVIIDVRISKGKLLEVESVIAKNPNVFAVYDVTGDFDAVVLARFPNRRKMDNFIKKLQKLDFVERTETKLILNTIKEEETGIYGL